MVKLGFERYFFEVGGENYPKGLTVSSDQIIVAIEILERRAIYVGVPSVDETKYNFLGCVVTRQNPAHQVIPGDKWSIKIISETEKGLEKTSRTLQLY